MQVWLNELFTTPQWNFTIFIGALLLGIIGAVGSGCNLAALGAIATYSGVKESSNKKDLLFTCLGFVIGTMMALILIGFFIGFIGQAAGNYIQTVGKFFSGIILVFFGLVTLDLFPLKLPSLKLPIQQQGSGIGSDILFGFALGGSTLSCTLACCSPIVPFLIGLSAVEGNAMKSAILMGIFGIGYTLPLVAIFLGFSFGKLAISAGKSITIIKKIAGLVLIIIGFYFLFTL